MIAAFIPQEDGDKVFIREVDLWSREVTERIVTVEQAGVIAHREELYRQGRNWCIKNNCQHLPDLVIEPDGEATLACVAHSMRQARRGGVIRIQIGGER